MRKFKLDVVEDKRNTENEKRIKFGRDLNSRDVDFINKLDYVAFKTTLETSVKITCEPEIGYFIIIKDIDISRLENDLNIYLTEVEH